MQAVLLVGGKGTRISDLYTDRPKALIPVCGRPFLEWQIEWLVSAGAKDIHLATGHMADAIEAWAPSAASLGASLTLSEEKHRFTGRNAAFRFRRANEN